MSMHLKNVVDRVISRKVKAAQNTKNDCGYLYKNGSFFDSRILYQNIVDKAD
jgi:hypothetical protein